MKLDDAKAARRQVPSGSSPDVAGSREQSLIPAVQEEERRLQETLSGALKEASRRVEQAEKEAAERLEAARRELPATMKKVRDLKLEDIHTDADGLLASCERETSALEEEAGANMESAVARIVEAVCRS